MQTQGPDQLACLNSLAILVKNPYQSQEDPKKHKDSCWIMLRHVAYFCSFPSHWSIQVYTYILNHIHILLFYLYNDLAKLPQALVTGKSCTLYTNRTLLSTRQCGPRKKSTLASQQISRTRAQRSFTGWRSSTWESPWICQCLHFWDHFWGYASLDSFRKPPEDTHSKVQKLNLNFCICSIASLILKPPPAVRC